MAGRDLGARALSLRTDILGWIWAWNYGGVVRKSIRAAPSPDRGRANKLPQNNYLPGSDKRLITHGRCPCFFCKGRVKSPRQPSPGNQQAVVDRSLRSQNATRRPASASASGSAFAFLPRKRSSSHSQYSERIAELISISRCWIRSRYWWRPVLKTSRRRRRSSKVG